MKKTILTKKISVILAVCVAVAIIISALIIGLSVNNKVYLNIARPNSIVVYNNSLSKNKVYESGSVEFENIYLNIQNSFKQSKWTALTKGKLFEKQNIQTLSSTIDFEGYVVNFIYDSPQSLKCNGNDYFILDKAVWYKSLVFNLNQNGWEYNSIAIIPPESSSFYFSPYGMIAYYITYSNFTKAEEFVSTLF